MHVHKDIAYAFQSILVFKATLECKLHCLFSQQKDSQYLFICVSTSSMLVLGKGKEVDIISGIWAGGGVEV